MADSKRKGIACRNCGKSHFTMDATSSSTYSGNDDELSHVSLSAICVNCNYYHTLELEHDKTGAITFYQKAYELRDGE